MEQKQPKRNYKVSSITARLVDCLVESQDLYGKVFTIASELYGEDDDAMQKPLLDSFMKCQEEICKIMSGSVISNIGDMANLSHTQVEI